MVDKKTEIKVGIAVSLGIALFVFTIFMLGKDNALFASTYKLHVAFNKIDGLGPGSVVRLNGLRVGNVESIEYDKELKKLQVILKVESKYQTIITKGSIAGLRTQGALGDKYVSITPSSEGNAPLGGGDWLEPEETGDLLSTLASRGSEIEKVFDILNELNTFTKNLNFENRSGRILDNLANATYNLNSLLKDFRAEDSNSLKRTLKSLASITEKIDRGQGTLGALINDPSIHEKIKALLGPTQRNIYMKSAIQQTISHEGQK